MTLHYRTQGFIFKKEDRLEADRIFSVFTKDFGRMEITAKSIRKIASKLRANTRLFLISDFEFVQGKHAKTLTDAFLVKKFANILAVPEKFQVACRLSGILNTFLKGQQQDDRLWNLIVDCFEILDACPEEPKHYALMQQYFTWNFFSVLGYAPQLNTCIICSKALKEQLLSFLVVSGGIACQACGASKKDANPIDVATVKILRLILQKDWNVLSKLKMHRQQVMMLDDVLGRYGRHIAELTSR
jgi:DNA repair protein RecO (recombination protein O)